MSKDDKKNILDIIEEIKSGVRSPRSLSIDERQMCVELLMADGVKKVEMAKLLGVSDKTIRRDIEVIRKANALIPTADFSRQLAGDVYQKGLSAYENIKRYSRSNNATIAEKITGEYTAWRVMKEMSEKLFMMGYSDMKDPEIFYENDQMGKTYYEIQEDLKKYTEFSKFRKLGIETYHQMENLTGMERDFLIKNIEKKILNMFAKEEDNKLEKNEPKEE